MGGVSVRSERAGFQLRYRQQGCIPQVQSATSHCSIVIDNLYTSVRHIKTGVTFNINRNGAIKRQAFA